MPKSLSYLLFDVTDEESGACAFDAMASVLPEHVPAVLTEVQAVLAWATHLFGAPCNDADEGDAGEWAFDLQATDQAGAPLALVWDFQSARVLMPPTVAKRLTLTLTVSGHRVFADAFRQAFADGQA